VLDIMPIEAGAFYVMDRGYLDFARLYGIHQTGAFFVTRAKRGMDARRLYSAPNDRGHGVICDQTIALDGHYTTQHYPEHLRRIRFRDTEAGRTLVFLTNQFGLPATTICALYKSRWQSLPPRRRGSNCSSNGSNSICASNASSGHPKMP
jgi:IS4 transposase